MIVVAAQNPFRRLKITCHIQGRPAGWHHRRGCLVPYLTSLRLTARDRQGQLPRARQVFSAQPAGQAEAILAPVGERRERVSWLPLVPLGLCLNRGTISDAASHLWRSGFWLTRMAFPGCGVLLLCPSSSPSAIASFPPGLFGAHASAGEEFDLSGDFSPFKLESSLHFFPFGTS